MVPQLAHGRILADSLYCVLLDNFADTLCQKETSRLKSLIRVPVIQLKYLVKGLFCDLSDALAEPPLIKGFFGHRALLDSFHVVQDDKRSAKELVLCCAV